MSRKSSIFGRKPLVNEGQPVALSASVGKGFEWSFDPNIATETPVACTSPHADSEHSHSGTSSRMHARTKGQL
jgi:hypothetical protein